MQRFILASEVMVGDLIKGPDYSPSRVEAIVSDITYGTYRFIFGEGRKGWLVFNPDERITLLKRNSD